MNGYQAMVPSQYTACYINSNRYEAQDVIQHLNAVGGLHVSYLAPPADLSLDLIHPDTQLFLVDWELDRLQESGVKVDYKGNTFARRIRDKFSHIPIALTTNQVIPANRRHYFVDPYLFDAQILKPSMVNEPEHVVAHCLNLIKGHQKLEKAPKTWSGLMEVLGVKEGENELYSEEEKIAEAAPPLLKENGGVTWLASEIAKWVQEVLLAYPGILLDQLSAATYLGITVEEFLSEKVQKLFQEARYEGVLAPAEGRWWKERLNSAAIDLIVEAELGPGSIYDRFYRAFEQVYGQKLQLAECVYSKKKPADQVCYILKKPVLLEYTLLYMPDNRPRVMDYALVSFEAIRRSDEVIDEYFPLSNRDLAQEVRNWPEDEF